MNPKLQARQMDRPETVVSDTLRAFEKGKRVAYPGKLLGRLSTWGARLMPRNMILRKRRWDSPKPQPEVTALQRMGRLWLAKGSYKTR
jgi:short-subunit dehydrogenase